MGPTVRRHPDAHHGSRLSHHTKRLRPRGKLRIRGRANRSLTRTASRNSGWVCGHLFRMPNSRSTTRSAWTGTCWPRAPRSAGRLDGTHSGWGSFRRTDGRESSCDGHVPRRIRPVRTPKASPAPRMRPLRRNRDLETNSDAQRNTAMTPAEMDSRIVRYGDLQPCKTAFIDAHTPGSRTKKRTSPSSVAASRNRQTSTSISASRTVSTSVPRASLRV